MTLSTDPVAVGFYIGILSTVILSFLVIRRLNRDKAKKDENMGCFSGGFISLVISSICILFFPFFIILVQSITNYVEYPRYEATVVDIQSEWVEHTTTDSDGYETTTDVLMHTAMLEFIDNDGNEVRQLNSISSGDEPKLEDKITVSYKNGDLQEFSFRAMAMMFGLAFILSILGFCLLLIINYGLNRNNDDLLKKGAWFLVTIIIPGVILLFFLAMANAVLQYFLGNDPDMPGVILGVLIFFCIVLFLVILGYIQMMFNKEK